jgi:hypothetical protein
MFSYDYYLYAVVCAHSTMPACRRDISHSLTMCIWREEHLMQQSVMIGVKTFRHAFQSVSISLGLGLGRGPGLGHGLGRVFGSWSCIVRPTKKRLK